MLDLVSIDDVDIMARRLRRAMETQGFAISDAGLLDLVAAQLGHADWSAASAFIRQDRSDDPCFTHLIPVLRSLDDAKCREFYCGFLGFEVVRTHQFEHEYVPHLLNYLVLRRGQVQIHLSDHPHHAMPGSAIFVWLSDIEGYRRELQGRNTHHLVREIADQPWGREMVFVDPFGNRLRFCERHDPL